MTIDVLVVLIPLLPLLAAGVIGVGHLLGALDGEADENTTAAIATWAIVLSCLLALSLAGRRFTGQEFRLIRGRTMAEQRRPQYSDQFYH